MYLEEFDSKLISELNGTLFSVDNVKKLEPNAKEYLYRLKKLGKIEQIYWGWYYLPIDQDVFSFLEKDRNFKILTKQTAASFWNSDFVHRNVISISVKDKSYGKALRELTKKTGWIFEIEILKNNIEYKKVGDLLVEAPESCIVNCISNWSFLDSLAVLYLMRKELSWNKLKKLSRWKRVSKTNTRVWNVLKYVCGEFNKKTHDYIFSIRKSSLSIPEIKNLVDEAVEKVVELG